MSSPDLDRERWERLVPHLAHARAKPTWEVEEREPRLALVDRFRRALEVTEPSEMPARVERLAPATRNRFALLLPQDLGWLQAWAADDPRSLEEALASFTSGTDPAARFEAWARADRCALEPEAALAVGSLFNFAVDPGNAPIMSHGPPPLEHDEPDPRGAAMYDWLESELGHERPAVYTLAARYRSHLHFAEQLHRRLLDAGVTVSDVLDVQALIFIAFLERDLWAVEPPPDTGLDVEPAPDTYLAVCALYRNEARYLPEWIEFHRAVGVERFFLYDNRSSDAHREVLAPYVQGGSVVIHEWPHLPVQMDVYNHCLEAHRGDARWIAFIDLDEFLFSPGRRPLPEVLRDYERYPGVGVNWAMFGTSGHATSPQGLVIESYLRRGDPTKGFIGRYVKSVVQPAEATRCLSAHRFEYRHGLAVDENGYPIHRDATKSVSFERLRINHYYTRSEAELRVKLERRQKLSATGTPPWQARPVDFERAKEEFNDEHDDLITAYGPEVRTALERALAR
jgi:hypothetical protein